MAILGFPSLVSHAQSHPLVIGYERFHSDTPTAEGGRILFNELGCVNCHDNPTGLPPRNGPHLKDITLLRNPNWLRSFLTNPTEAKPGTTMPQMHLTEEDTEAVLHYLASLTSTKKAPQAFKFVNAERGMSLYHEFGCVACHAPSQDFYPPAGKPNTDTYSYPSVPLVELDKRYDIHSLSAFLVKPHDYWPEGRMPQFRLEREDGGDLAAFLLDYHNGDSTDYPIFPHWEVEHETSMRGKTIVQEKNCIVCHTLPDSGFDRPAKRTGIQRAQPFPKTHPEYSLTPHQLTSIERFLNAEPNSPPAISHLQTLNCLACHSRNGEGGPDRARSTYFSGDPDLGDTGRLPPPLTEIGRKLQPEWLSGALTGTKTVRPYLRTQMPVFGDSVLGLAERLIDEDQNQTTHTKPFERSIEAGRQLLGTQGGFNCITCHNWGDRQSLGIQALNISNMAERLNLDWLHDYLIEPSIYRPNTLMPSFWPDGLASNSTILAGDTKAQISAIYTFSKHGEGLPIGFPDEISEDYEIIPSDRPVIQRSFMEGIGTNVILVGFPEGVHLAFNGTTGSPAMLWKGRFYDAYRTWFSRFPEFEKPLGDKMVRWSIENSNTSIRYQGYRLDPTGNPGFLLTSDGVDLIEYYEPYAGENDEPNILRTIRYRTIDQRNALEPAHPVGVKVTEVKEADHLTRSFIYQW